MFVKHVRSAKEKEKIEKWNDLRDTMASQFALSQQTAHRFHREAFRWQNPHLHLSNVPLQGVVPHCGEVKLYRGVMEAWLCTSTRDGNCDPSGHHSPQLSFHSECVFILRIYKNFVDFKTEKNVVRDRAHVFFTNENFVLFFIITLQVLQL